MNKVTTGRTLIALSVALGAIGSTIIDNIPGPNGHGSCPVPGWWLLGLGGVSDGYLI